MQFPVPQFTDVEDRIIGPLTLKQFGILFGAGIVIFLGYSSSKSVLVVIFLFVLFGIPALGISFAKINGRPVYNTFGTFARFMSSPKILIFHKEARHLSSSELRDAQTQSPTVTKAAVPETKEDTQTHLKEVQALLRKTAEEETEIADKL